MHNSVVKKNVKQCEDHVKMFI